MGFWVFWVGMLVKQSCFGDVGSSVDQWSVFENPEFMIQIVHRSFHPAH